jgi:nitrite reductase (NO-forming)
MFRRTGRLTLSVALVLSLAACAAPVKPGWTFAPAAPAAPGGTTADASGAPVATLPDTGDAAGKFEIKAFDLGFDPAMVTVDKPGAYDVTFRNTGAVPHDVTFEDGTKIAANPGEAKTATVTVPTGGIKFICSIPGHSAAGMQGEVMVGGGAAAASPSAAPASSPAAGGSDSHGGPLPVGDVKPDPNAPPYKLYDATAPALLPGTTHDIDLVITEEEKTVATGFVQKVWTFGGTVPGPVIRVKVGDTIRVHLKNPATNQMAHSIDFHASQVAWNDEMTSINPGQEKVYEWKAEYAGVWMYHCGTNPALHHIANGMYGMVIVEPREGLPKVDSEFAIVQSEWYLGPQGKETDLTKAMAAAPAPDLVLFNGVANQYKDHPLQVKTGGTVRVFILDAGPSEDSSFHIVGTIFNTVIKEGVTLTKGNAGNWGSQAVDLSPAQGAIVEFTTAEDGLYPMVTHAFNFVGRGALGLVQAGDGDPKN